MTGSKYSLELKQEVGKKHVVISMPEEYSFEVNWENFIDSFYKNRLFALNNLSLPKVTVYNSCVFSYKNHPHAFLFFSLNPKVEHQQYSEEKTINSYVPWQHCFVLINKATFEITEFILFFSWEQIKSETLHDFFVPNIQPSKHSDYNLGPSEFLTHIGIKKNVFFWAHSVTYNDSDFGKTCRSIRNSMIGLYFSFSNNTELLSTKKEKFVKHYSSFMIDDPISIKIFDDFSHQQQIKPYSLKDVIDFFYEERKNQ